MEEQLAQAARLVAELIEAVAVLLIAYGAGEAFVNSFRHVFRHTYDGAGARRCLCVLASGCC